MAKELRISQALFEQIKSALYIQEAERLRTRTTEDVYTDYVLQQMSCVKDLTDACKRFEASKKSTALVGAIKARSEIWDKIIKQGQDLGVINKEPERMQFVGGLAVAELTEDKLRSLITGEISNLDTLMEQFGDVKDITEMRPGNLHLPAPKGVPGGKKRAQNKGKAVGHSKPEGTKRTQKAIANRVHGGRRVVHGSGK